jgi:hypothetical protein
MHSQTETSQRIQQQASDFLKIRAKKLLCIDWVQK